MGDIKVKILELQNPVTSVEYLTASLIEWSIAQIFDRELVQVSPDVYSLSPLLFTDQHMVLYHWIVRHVEFRII